MEITANLVQTVTTNQNVLFSDIAVPGSDSIIYREGSGIVKLRGLAKYPCPRARFKAFFNGNIAIPTSGSVGAIDIAISIDGEPVQAAQMEVTPAAGQNYFNVAAEVYIDVPAGCCSIVSVENTSTQSILVKNANLIVERVA